MTLYETAEKQIRGPFFLLGLTEQPLLASEPREPSIFTQSSECLLYAVQTLRTGWEEAGVTQVQEMPKVRATRRTMVTIRDGS